MSEQVKEDIRKIVGQINEKRYLIRPFREYFSNCDVIIDPTMNGISGEILWKDSGDIVRKIDKTVTYQEIPFKLRLKVNSRYLELPQEIRDGFWAHEINESLLMQNSRFSRFIQYLRRYFLLEKLAAYLVHLYVDRENKNMGYHSTKEIIDIMKEHGMST
jgi:hypothetical protein